MATQLSGKVAVITGAAKGIGYACAVSLGKLGARVVVADWDESAGRSAAEALATQNIDANFVKCDVSSKSDCERLVKAAVDKYHALDVLIANAGIVRTGDFLDMSEADFDAVLNVNLKGVFLSCQAAARQMVEQNKAQPGRGGCIITMTSVNAVMAIPSIAGYNAAKGGVNNLTRNMALSLAPHKIRVNGIGPGSIRTDVLNAVVGDRAALERVLSRTPLGRVGEPEEIGSVAAFLASDAASYITGQIIYVDGGRMAMNYTCPVPEQALPK